MIKFAIALVSDAEILRDIAISAFEEDKIKYGFTPPGIETIEWHLSKINNGMYYKIMVEDKIVGAINLYDLKNNHFRLGAVYIEPSYQNKGIGTKAISFIENTYPDINKWSLDTPYKNYKNHKFYEKHGYVKIDEVKPMENIDFFLFEYEKEIKK